ncbi:MAG TPA: SapC family protein [Nevskiaceae bacterium]|nr:SapC family protein [Nevskiaceae bacterium]
MPDSTLAPPPGYTTIAPLDKQKHAGLGLKPGIGYAWAAQLNAVFIGAAEMPRAALDFPIAFVRDQATGEFVPVSVLGLKQNQNLFVDAGGRWREHHYVPAYLRRYPFCLADIPSPGGQEARHLICVDESQLVAGAPPLFDAAGQPTAAWEPMRQLIEALETARQQTRALCKRLEALQLLVPFDAVAVPRAGERMRLAGMFRIDEEKLALIPLRDLRMMLKRAEMRAVYAHLLSLENFAKLMDLAVAR